MDKKIVHQKVPEFDQQSQYVVELEPVEMDDHIYIGCEVRDMPEQDDSEMEMF